MQLWIDGTVVMHWNGKDPADLMFQRVYTKRLPWLFGQYQSVINRGAARAQSRWYDNISVWTR